MGGALGSYYPRGTIFTPSMLRVPYRALRGSAREFFFMERETRAAVSATLRARLQPVVEAAAARWSVAYQLADPPQAIAALTLYREAVELLLWGAALRFDGEPSADVGDTASVLATFRRAVEAGQLDRPPPEVDASIDFVRRRGLLAIDSETADARTRMKATLEAAIRWLRSRVEPRTMSEVHRARVLRAAAASLIAVALLVWSASHLLAAKNLALHRPVRASSYAPESAAPRDGSGLTNGDKEGSYGIHTSPEESPWVVIDLQRSYVIADVKIFNRGDGWFDEGLPLVLELSEDGEHFAEVSRRTESFSQSSPWTYVGSAGARARYVRVRAPHRGYIALSEIEVHGHR